MNISQVASASELQGVTDGYSLNKRSNKFVSNINKVNADKPVTYDTAKVLEYVRYNSPKKNLFDKKM